MKVTIQEYVPYESSRRWSLHESYFRDMAGLTHLWTSNYPICRQHAQLVVELVRELEQSGKLKAGDEVNVLEVGAGQNRGEAAHSFLRALAGGCGPEGAKLAARVRYILSDASAEPVRDALKKRALQELAAKGRIVPALFDPRSPAKLNDLEGKPLKGTLTATIANFTFSTMPLKMVRKNNTAWLEKHVMLRADILDEDKADPNLIEPSLAFPRRQKLMKRIVASHQWRATKLNQLFSDPVHADAVTEILKPFETATMPYPFMALDLVRTLEGKTVPGGLFLVNDYGSVSAADLKGRDEHEPQHAGTTMIHALNFAILDAWTKRAGYALARTTSALRSLNVAAIRYGKEMPAGFRAAFDKGYLENEDGEDLVDFTEAAEKLIAEEDHAVAARFLKRCAKLDPENVEVLYALGEACVEAESYEAALAPLEKARALDAAGAYEIDFLLGRALHGLQRHGEAIEAFQRSMAKTETPYGHANLGLVYEDLKDFKKAYQAYRRALELDPDDESAQTLLSQLATTYADAALAGS